MKTKNWIVMLILAVSGLAHAKTWEERKAAAKTKLALTDTAVTEAFIAFTAQVDALKLDREAHKDETADNTVKADHGIDLSTKTLEEIKKINLN